MNAIEIKNLCFKYGEEEKFGIENLSIDIERGSFVAIVGRNASGKSTLAKLITGLLTATGGEITVCGYCLNDAANLFEVRKRCGIVFQNPDNQAVATIVEDDIAFGPENIGAPREDIEKRIDFALKATGTEEFRNCQTSKLSGGQKQRVAIAGALALRPEILILDESTSMLDPEGRKEVLATVARLNKEYGMTVILITHYMDEAISADRIAVMSDGEIVLMGSPNYVFGCPNVLKDAKLEMPFAAAVSHALIESGLPVGVALDDEKLAEELCRFK